MLHFISKTKHKLQMLKESYSLKNTRKINKHVTKRKQRQNGRKTPTRRQTTTKKSAMFERIPLQPMCLITG